MKYLCLAYYDEEKFNAMEKAALNDLASKCPPHDDALRASGQLLVRGSLGPPQASSVIRPRRGRPVVSDGPFAETTEQVGGFFIIEARDLNDAIRIAGKHPAAQLGEAVGWAVEVRPIEAYEQP